MLEVLERVGSVKVVFTGYTAVRLDGCVNRLVPAASLLPACQAGISPCPHAPTSK